MEVKIEIDNQLETELLIFIVKVDIDDPTKDEAIADVLCSMFDICHKYFEKLPFSTINNTWNKVVTGWDIRLIDLLNRCGQSEIERRVKLN